MAPESPTPKGWSAHGKGDRPQPASIYPDGTTRFNEGTWRTTLDETDRICVFTRTEETALLVRPTDKDDVGFALSSGNAKEQGRFANLSGALQVIGVWPWMLTSAAHPDVSYDRDLEGVRLDCDPVVDAMVGGGDDE